MRNARPTYKAGLLVQAGLDELLQGFAVVALQGGGVVLGDEEQDLHGVHLRVGRFPLGQLYGCDAQGPDVCLHDTKTILGSKHQTGPVRSGSVPPSTLGRGVTDPSLKRRSLSAVGVTALRPDGTVQLLRADYGPTFTQPKGATDPLRPCGPSLRPPQGRDAHLPNMLTFRRDDAAARAVIGPLTQTRRRTIKVHDCVEASALRECGTIISP